MLRAQIDSIKPMPPVPASSRTSKKRKKLDRDRERHEDHELDHERDQADPEHEASISDDSRDDDPPLIDEYA